MDQVCKISVSDSAAVVAAGDGPAKRASGDVPAAGGDCFDCNICLDFAVEPVVTLCGHLFCWPCIYEWLRCDAGGGGGSTRRPCPVCKGAISPDALVPLYGRGGSAKKPRHDGAADIPRRPAVHLEAAERQSARRVDDGDHYYDESTEPRHAHRRHAGAARLDDVLYPPPLTIQYQPTAGGMLGGMAVAVLPRVLRGHVHPPASTYYSSPYHLAAMQNMGPRMRRRHMEVEKSLHQIWFFLCVLAVVCLLLF